MRLWKNCALGSEICLNAIGIFILEFTLGKGPKFSKRLNFDNCIFSRKQLLIFHLFVSHFTRIKINSSFLLCLTNTGYCTLIAVKYIGGHVMEFITLTLIYFFLLATELKTWMAFCFAFFKNDHLGDWKPKKDFWWRLLTLRQPVRKPSSQVKMASV